MTKIFQRIFNSRTEGEEKDKKKENKANNPISNNHDSNKWKYINIYRHILLCDRGISKAVSVRMFKRLGILLNHSCLAHEHIERLHLQIFAFIKIQTFTSGIYCRY